jgi:hypothetical protein
MSAMHIARDTEEDNMKNVLAALALATSALPVAAAPPLKIVLMDSTGKVAKATPKPTPVTKKEIP